METKKENTEAYKIARATVKFFSEKHKNIEKKDWEKRKLEYIGKIPVSSVENRFYEVYLLTGSPNRALILVNDNFSICLCLLCGKSKTFMFTRLKNGLLMDVDTGKVIKVK